MSKVFIEDEHKNILANANEDPFVIDQVGTDCFVNGVRQDRLDFTSNPQEQLDENKTGLTTLASKVETNTSEIDSKIKGHLLTIGGSITKDISLTNGNIILIGSHKISFFNEKTQTTELFNGKNIVMITRVYNIVTIADATTQMRYTTNIGQITFTITSSTGGLATVLEE